LHIFLFKREIESISTTNLFLIYSKSTCQMVHSFHFNLSVLLNHSAPEGKDFENSIFGHPMKVSFYYARIK